jgi:hypothetical protein
MAGTRRIPINRPPRSVVTERAVSLFKLALTHHDPDDEIYRKLSLELHRELGLRPWHPDVLLDVTADMEEPQFKHALDLKLWREVRDLRQALVSMT